jgi:hypothetical protein
MNLSLLECVYAVKDRVAIERWLPQVDPTSVLICTMQYDDEILAVLASEQRLWNAYLKISRHPAISACEEKHAIVFRLTTTLPANLVVRSFPFREGEEWYQGADNTAYICLQSHELSHEQLAWLAICPHIRAWESSYALAPVTTGAA